MTPKIIGRIEPDSLRRNIIYYWCLAICARYNMDIEGQVKYGKLLDVLGRQIPSPSPSPRD